MSDYNNINDEDEDNDFIIISGNNTLWNMNSKNVNEEVKNYIKKKISNKKPIYEFFRTLENEEDDIEWKNIYYKAIYGIFPKGYKFNNGKLNYRIKTRSNSLEFDSEITSRKIKDFFKKCSKFVSKKDLDKEEKVYNEKNIEVKEIPINWSKIKISFSRIKIAISCFCSKKAKELKLNSKEINSLYHIVLEGINCDYFNNKNILTNDYGEIIEIKNLIFDEEERSFKIIKEQPIKKTFRRKPNSKVEFSNSPQNTTFMSNIHTSFTSTSTNFSSQEDKDEYYKNKYTLEEQFIDLIESLVNFQPRKKKVKVH